MYATFIKDGLGGPDWEWADMAPEAILFCRGSVDWWEQPPMPEDELRRIMVVMIKNEATKEET